MKLPKRTVRRRLRPANSSMPLISKKLQFDPKEFKGSRLRCLQLTSLLDEEVARFLTGLITPHGKIDTNDIWRPRGMPLPGEVDWQTTTEFLSEGQRREAVDWWLSTRHGNSRTPNWDLVSTCAIPGGRKGLLLLEAKAHPAELPNRDECKAGVENRPQIERAVAEAQQQLNHATGGWALNAHLHYQLSNRFAWAWKIASMGIPVILVYLGFLNAREMITDTRTVFRSRDEWEKRLREYSKGVVPPSVWNDTMLVNRTPLTALIRAAEISVECRLVT